MRSYLTVEQRFWTKVDKNGPVPDYAPHLGNCWLWTGQRSSSGLYGVFYAEGYTKPRVRAHRFAFGHVPDGLVLDHLCRVTLCVRPSHLEAVTDRENLLRGVGAPAKNAVKTHCKYGHAFTADNTFTPSEGGRRCRACVAAYNAKRVARRFEHRDPDTWGKPRKPSPDEICCATIKCTWGPSKGVRQCTRWAKEDGYCGYHSPSRERAES